MNDATAVQNYLKSLTVLLVEDDRDARKQLSAFMSRLVGKLVTAQNGAEGVEVWRQQTPDIIITDIRMPVMDGLAMLQEIRSLDPDVPVIILSAFEDSAYLKRSIDLGVSGYVNKPVNFTTFTDALRRCAWGLLAEDALRKQEQFTNATLDGLSAHICVVNSDGKIISTNRAWDNFAAENHSAPEVCCVGSNYLDACRVAVPDEEPDIGEFQAGLTAVLDGKLSLFAIEYECSTPQEVRWFSAKVNPFIVADKLYAVISHVDITQRKQLEQEVRNALEYAENIVETMRDPMLVLDSSLKIITANSSFYETFKVSQEETIGNFIYDLGNRQWDIPKLRLLLEDILPRNSVFNNYEVEHDFQDIGHKTIILNAREIFRKDIGSHIILLVFEDITQRKLAEDALQEKNDIIARLAMTDELTALNNRRFFNDNFSRELSAARRHQQPLSLITIDLDHFKKVNDTFGHAMGDLVLKEFSAFLKTMLRAEDIACRMGGEEFIVLLPNTTCEDAVTLAERIRLSFRQLPRTSTPLVTASFGVAQLQEDENEDDLMIRVDDALYQAKEEGRNRVVVS